MDALIEKMDEITKWPEQSEYKFIARQFEFIGKCVTHFSILYIIH